MFGREAGRWLLGNVRQSNFHVSGSMFPVRCSTWNIDGSVIVPANAPLILLDPLSWTFQAAAHLVAREGAGERSKQGYRRRAASKEGLLFQSGHGSGPDSGSCSSLARV